MKKMLISVASVLAALLTLVLILIGIKGFVEDYFNEKASSDEKVVAFSPREEVPPPEGYLDWKVYYQLNELPPEGWERCSVAEIGHIDYPAAYLEVPGVQDSGIWFRKFLESRESREGKNIEHLVLQQAGLNDLRPEVWDDVKRVAFSTYYFENDKKGPVFYDEYTWSQSELVSLAGVLIENAKAVDEGVDIIEDPTVEIESVNDMRPVLVQFTLKHYDDNSPLRVKIYCFMDYDKMHLLFFVCTPENESECRDIYDSILQSLTFY